MKLIFTKTHKSISSFEWDNIAPLSIITGLNGAGKSQLLEVISQEYNAAFDNKINGGYENQNFLGSKFKYSKATQGANNFGNISLDNQKFNYSDLRLIVDTIYNYKNPKPINHSYHSGFTYEQDVQLNILQEAKNSTNPFYYLAKSKAPVIWQFLVSTLGKEDKHITPFDISLNFPEQLLFDDYQLSNGASIGLTFFLFEYKRLAREKAGIPPTNDTPPWQILNEAIEASNLPYKILPPDSEDIARIFQDPLNNSLSVPFSVTIKHTIKGYNPQFYELSSGERILMSLAMLLYYAKGNGFEQDILVLDEPDAHLHPSMTQQFFRVVYDVLVKRHGVTVIMTTHSPSTVALAPEESDCVVYELRKDPTTITPVISRERAIESLTEGMVLVMPAMRTVLIEGKDDRPFYEAIYTILKNKKIIESHTTLSFVTGTGKDSVHHWSKGLREAGLSGTIRGIIDKDNNNEVSDGIVRLERYSIENYMLEPVLILVTARSIPNTIIRHGLQPGNEDMFRDFTQHQVQEITDSLLNHIASKLNNLQPQEAIKIPIEFANAFIINYPSWFLNRKGKELFGVFNEEFGRNLNRVDLTNSLKRIQFIPKDILRLFQAVQN